VDDLSLNAWAEKERPPKAGLGAYEGLRHHE